MILMLCLNLPHPGLEGQLVQLLAQLLLENWDSHSWESEAIVCLNMITGKKKKTFFFSYIVSPVEWLVSYFFVMVLFTGCDQICVEPLTASPFGSPCGCVFPMKVRLLLDIAPYSIFPVMSELEIEVAEGTYLAQSQVIIMGASADSQNQGRTVVDINLVPLGEKFDNTTAILTYDRFKHKKVPLNMTLFGNYEVLYISYPGTNLNSPMLWLIILVFIVVLKQLLSGIPSSPPYLKGNGPTGSPQNLPITAKLTRKNQKMNTRTIAIIALSAFVLLLVILGAISILIKWRKVGRPSSAVGPARESSLHKRSGKYVAFQCSE